jgi:hypothetical protein
MSDPTPLEKSKMLRLDSDVYCLAHTCVHENSLDPYGEGPQTCLKIWNGTGVGTKKTDVHRTLFWGGRKGDYPDA